MGWVESALESAVRVLLDIWPEQYEKQFGQCKSGAGSFFGQTSAISGFKRASQGFSGWDNNGIFFSGARGVLQTQ